MVNKYCLTQLMQADEDHGGTRVKQEAEEAVSPLDGSSAHPINNYI